MAIDKDLNVSPYFDDFDEEKNFHQILFKPAVAVQARELTQLQTILQNQIERFGNNILREGTIIQGCNFVEILDVGYIKILDLQADGQPVSMSTYDQARAVGDTSGIEAKIITVATGLQTQSPDLNTLFVKYLTTGSSGEKQFLDNERIVIKNFDTGETIATVTTAGTIESNPVGSAYGTRVSDGIIYQKGFFIRVEEQIQIVSKYSSEPNDVVVGFETIETIVNSNADTSLLDNANGFNNFNAPGADRLKLTADLVVKTLDEAKADETFFAIQEYNRGEVVRRNRTTQYAEIFNQIQRRTKEESGDYTVKNFPISVETNTANNETLDILIGAGSAYVEGRRIELLNTFDINVDKSIDFKTQENQDISTNIGQYILVDEYFGNFDPNISPTIDLYDTVQEAANNGAVPVSPSGTKIGEAKIRALTYENGTVGDKTAQYRAYIFDIQMNSNTNFSDVASIYYSNGTASEDGAADLVSTRIYEPKFAKSLFSVGRKGLRKFPATGTTLDFIYRTSDKTLTLNGATGQMTINLSSGTWPYGNGTLNSTQKKDILLIAKENQTPYIEGKPIDLDTATITISGTSMSISGLATASSDVNVIGYFNVKQSAAQPTRKDLETVYVKIDCATNSSNTSVGDYSLGLPDVFSIENIYVGSTYSESNMDRKTDFRFNTGQKDTFYGISSIKKKRNATLNPSDKILVKAKVFKRDTSGIFGDGFFTINSYPTEIQNVVSPEISVEEIPRYTSETGVVYDLRDTVDFRPYVENTAVYATTIGDATENPTFVNEFPGTELFTTAPNEVLESDYEYFLARKDLVIINENGEFTSIRGIPSENPVAPADTFTGMVLATVNIPVYPSLPKREADVIGRSDLGVTLQKRQNKRYTMKDIGDIDSRIKKLEYYTTLNSLETDAKDFLITDADGNNRFKNGIFADNFQDFGGAEVTDPDFAAAINQSSREMTPRFKAYPMDLKPSGTWTNVDADLNFDTAALAKISEQALIEQPYATNFRNCTTDFYSFNGQAAIFPEYDGAYNTTQAPAVNIDIDLTTPFVEFTEALSEFVPLQRSDVVRSVDTQWGIQFPFVTFDRTTTETTTTQELTVQEAEATTQRAGNFITDFRFQPFLRSREIKISVNGLRPNTQHYFFFDGKNVNADVAPAETAGSTSLADIRSISTFGTPVTSDSNGNLLAVFLIPENTFYVGDRTLEIFDVNDYSSANAATSRARVTYRGFNFDVERTGLSVATRVPSFDVDVNVSSSTTTSRWFWYPDPISQTFSIKENQSRDSVLMLSKIDVYFARKSETQGVTLEIRETENGFPSYRKVPFSKVHLTPDQVNVSSTGTVATTFTFSTPVTLKTGADYAIVVLPDQNDPDYLIWISRTGETDIATGQAITRDTHDGVLFTSTNNKAWTPYQDENLKFTLYSQQHAASGTMYLTNKNTEFFTISSIQNDFRVGEKVLKMNANVDGSASVSSSSKTITGAGLSIFNPGDYIAYYSDNTTIHSLLITTVTDDTEISVESLPPVSNSNTSYFKTVVGEISYYDRNNPARLFIENSSAASGTYNYTDDTANTVTTANYFEVNDTIYGEITKSEGTIDSINNLKSSYIQGNVITSGFKYTNVSMVADKLISEDTNADYAAANPVPVSFKDDTVFDSTPTIIKSRSNEVVDGTLDSFRLKLDLSNSYDGVADATPIVDFGSSVIMSYEYIINNPVDANGILTDGTVFETDGDEIGPANSKYISKRITLRDGFDAEDLKVYVTAYRPAGTDVRVYARFKNVTDSRDFNTIEWTPMIIKNETNQFSAQGNKYDYQELEFDMPIQSAAEFTAGGGAALNSDNNEVLRYIDENGTIFETYKSFAIKIVMLSDSHRIVPKLKDVRSIALT